MYKVRGGGGGGGGAGMGTCKKVSKRMHGFMTENRNYRK